MIFKCHKPAFTVEYTKHIKHFIVSSEKILILNLMTAKHFKI